MDIPATSFNLLTDTVSSQPIANHLKAWHGSYLKCVIASNWLQSGTKRDRTVTNCFSSSVLSCRNTGVVYSSTESLKPNYKIADK